MSNERNNIGKKAGVIGIIANVVLALGKLAVGIISSSMSIIADALNNFSDSISSIVTLAGFKLAQKPADSDHPYGHARFEYLAGLIVCVLILVVGFELIKSSIEKIITPSPINFSIVTIAVLCVSIITKFILCIYNAKVAKKINSNTLKAVSDDCRNDVIMTTVVLASTLVEHFSGWSIDAYSGLLVSVFILFSGIKLIKETASPILGKKDDGVLKQKILDKIKEYPIVLGYHDLMIHDYGPGISFCSIHFEIDKNLDPLYVHEIIDKFEREFLEIGTNLTVHYDPVVTDSPILNKLKHEVVCACVEYDSRLTIHDFRSIPCDGFTKIFFDIPLPEELSDKKIEITNILNNRLNSLGIEKYECVITFESSAFN